MPGLSPRPQGPHLDHVFTRRQVEHHVRQYLLDDGAEAARAGTALERLLRDCAKARPSSKVSSTSSSSNTSCIFWSARFFGFLRIRTR